MRRSLMSTTPVLEPIEELSRNRDNMIINEDQEVDEDNSEQNEHNFNDRDDVSMQSISRD